MITVGKIDFSCTRYVQKCKKCGTEHESDHLLVWCRAAGCNGTMTRDLNLHNYTEEGDHIDD